MPQPSGATHQSSEVMPPPPEDPSARQADLNKQAAELVGKIEQLAPWEDQKQKFASTIERVFADNKLTNDSEQFFKRLLIETHKPRPADVAERFKVFVDTVADRYNLDEKQKQDLRQLAVSQTFVMAMKHGHKLVPLMREALDSRLAKQPVTAEQVARWSKVARPILEDVYTDSLKKVQPLLKNLTPEQRQLVDKDLGVLDKRLNEVRSTMMNSWEKGRWEPKHWAIEDDPIQMGQVAAAQVKDPSAQFNTGNDPSGAGGAGPARFGDTRNDAHVRVSPQPTGPPLPDEDTWVAYVRQFCARYNLDEAQQATAQAILKDLQEQAQAYRSSRSEEIDRLQTQLRQAESAQERGEIQAELSEVLAGVDGLFKELKARLENIPTSEQIRGGG